MFLVSHLKLEVVAVFDDETGLKDTAPNPSDGYHQCYQSPTHGWGGGAVAPPAGEAIKLSPPAPFRIL